MTNDIASELAKLHELSGADYSRQVERIALMGVFHPLESDEGIYTVGVIKNEDYQNQLVTARKIVELGYRVFILPNPKSGRTPDFILERKGIYRIYDLKTITGDASAINRLRESIGQCNQVIMNMATNYNARQLAKDIKCYFVENPGGLEVMIIKGLRQIVVKRKYALSQDFIKTFIIRYKTKKSR